MIVALAAAAALACPDGLCTPRALDPFLTKLAEARHGRSVHILQIGDSHTAGDAISGAWRDILQARYGSGGRGILPPGRPYDGYLARGVQVTMSPGWKIAADFGPASQGARPPLGLSAFSLTSQSEGAKFTLTADPPQQFSRLVLCAIAQPGGGNLSIDVGGVTETMDLGSVTTRPVCHSVRSATPQTTAEIMTEGGPVTVTSWATFRDGGGVVLSNLGVVGSQLVHFARTDDAVLAEELHAYTPDLIVLAFGTNEGFSPRFSPFEYDIVLRTQIGRLRRLAGNVPILLLGAPDASSRRAEMRANAGGAAAQDCPAVGAPTPTLAAPSSPTDAAGGLSGIMARLRQTFGMDVQAGGPAVQAEQAAPAAPAAGRPGLFAPPALAAVRDVQRRVAASLRVAYWDWNGRMGGECAAIGWVRAVPPLMRGDYVHYTSAGGRELAQRLQADLDRADQDRAAAR